MKRIIHQETPNQLLLKLAVCACLLPYLICFRKEIQINGLPMTDLDRKGSPTCQVEIMTERLLANIEKHMVQADVEGGKIIFLEERSSAYWNFSG